MTPGRSMPVHLVRTGTNRNNRVTACGVHNPARYTKDPDSVECGACKRTLFMADAEIKKQRRRKNR